MKRLKCIFGHDWEFTGKTADWLAGGTYYYQCRRCYKIISAKPHI